MLRSLFATILLTLTLLSAQLGGLSHDIAHALGERSQDSSQTLPHDKHCDRCAAYAQIGGAVGSSDIRFAVGNSRATAHPPLAQRYRSSSFVAFAARAPPRWA